MEFSRPEYWSEEPFFSLGDLPPQGSNPGLQHWRWILYQLSHKGSPRILEWVPYPFSSRSSWPRNWSGVYCTAGGFFTNWAIKEALTPAIGLYFPYPLEDCPSLIHCTMYHGHRGGHEIQQIWIWIWGSQKQWAAEVESPAGRALRMHHKFLLLRSCPSF